MLGSGIHEDGLDWVRGSQDTYSLGDNLMNEGHLYKSFQYLQHESFKRGHQVIEMRTQCPDVSVYCFLFIYVDELRCLEYLIEMKRRNGRFRERLPSPFLL